MTAPLNTWIVSEWEIRNLSWVGCNAAKAAFTSGPGFRFGRASSVNGIVLVSGSDSLKLRSASLVRIREVVQGENI